MVREGEKLTIEELRSGGEQGVCGRTRWQLCRVSWMGERVELFEAPQNRRKLLPF